MRHLTKSTYLVLLFSCIVFSGYAQSWFEHNPVWTSGYRGFGLAGVLYQRVVGDTMLQGIECKRIENTYLEVDSYNPYDTAIILVERFAYELDDRVYFYCFIDDTFHIAYDMNLGVGDRIIYECTYCPTVDTLVVVETRITLLGSRSIKQQALRRASVDTSSGYGELLVYSGIGNFASRRIESGDTTVRLTGKLNFLELFDCVYSDPEPELRCYESDSLSLRLTDIPCDTIELELPNGVGDITSDSEVNIYPNPTLGRVTIDLPKDVDPIQLRIYSISGVVVKFLSLPRSQQYDVNLMELPAGLYYVQIKGATWSWMKALVKQ